MASDVRFVWHGETFAREFGKAAAKGIGAAADSMAQDVRKSFTRTARHQSSAPGTPPGIQRGGLRRSVHGTDGILGATGVHARVVADVPYAAIQEQGGTITPKSARALAIPIHPSAKRASELGKSPRDIPNLFMVKKDDGRSVGILAKEIKGKNARLEIWYVLRRAVTLAARPFMAPIMNSETSYKKAGERFAKVAAQEMIKSALPNA